MASGSAGRHPGGRGALGDHRPPAGGPDDPGRSGLGRAAGPVRHRHRPGGRPRPRVDGRAPRTVGDRARPWPVARVVVTRTRAQASDLVDRLSDLGATVVELPVIAIEAPRPTAARLWPRPPTVWWPAPTSGWCSPRPTRWPASWPSLGDRAVPAVGPWAAVGRAPPGPWPRADGPPTWCPTASVSEALAEAFPRPAPASRPSAPTTPNGRRTVLFPRAETVAGCARRGLRAKGWLVDEVVAYRTVADDPGPDAVPPPARADAIAFTSSSTVDRPVELLRCRRDPAGGGLHRTGHLGLGPGGRAGGGRRGRPATPSTGWSTPWSRCSVGDRWRRPERRRPGRAVPRPAVTDRPAVGWAQCE